MLLRQSLLFLSRHRELETFLQDKALARRAAARYIAGDGRSDALSVARRLADDGFGITLDFLGEDVRSTAEAGMAADEYGLALRENIPGPGEAGISVRLSHLGLRLEPDLARDHLVGLAERAREASRWIWIDMESSDLTDATFDLAADLHAAFGRIGVTVQANLKRSSGDIDRLNRAGVPVRLVKGNYLEPQEGAYQDVEEITLYYMRLVEALMRDGTLPVIATHDPKLAEFAVDMAFIFSREPDRFEFQMLYGIHPALQRSLLDQGYRVRIYLPYGEQWYPYFMRRLAERPSHLWHLLRKNNDVIA